MRKMASGIGRVIDSTIDSTESGGPSKGETPVFSLENTNPRYGSFSFIYENRFYLLGGSPFQSLLERFDVKLGWTKIVLKGDDLPVEWAGIQGCVVNECVFVYGGFCGTASYAVSGRSNALRKIDLANHRLDVVQIQDSNFHPMRKDKYGCVVYENKLHLFGGYGMPHKCEADDPHSSFCLDYDSFSGLGWTNEFHALDINHPQWVPVETLGYRPPPCAAFSFTKIDTSRVVLFGGRQRIQRVNDIYILDLKDLVWRGPILPSVADELWPIPRSFHTTVALHDPDNISSLQKPKLLVFWGMDRETEPINDAWILNVETMKWEQMVNSPTGPRVWHTSTALYSRDGTQVFIFGGTKYNLFRDVQGYGSLSHLYVSKFGVSNLSHIILCYIANNWNLMERKLEHLPHVYQQVVAEYKYKSDVLTEVNQFALQQF